MPGHRIITMKADSRRPEIRFLLPQFRHGSLSPEHVHHGTLTLADHETVWKAGCIMLMV